jgi:hypothetical protein
MTRDEMYQALERAKISPAGQRGYHLLWRNAQEGLICFGAPRGKHQTFVLLDEWVPPAKPLRRDEALAKLVLRYFASHGPATLKDFVWWSGLTMQDAKDGIERVSSSLASKSVNSIPYWMDRCITSLKRGSPVVNLLPGFDEYILGYTDRSPVLNPLHSREVYRGVNLLFNPTILVDGHVEGTWKRVMRRDKVDLILKPFKTLGKAEAHALTRAIRRYGEFMNTRPPSNG